MKRRKRGERIQEEGVVAMGLGEGFLQMLGCEGSLGDHLVLFSCMSPGRRADQPRQTETPVSQACFLPQSHGPCWGSSNLLV